MSGRTKQIADLIEVLNDKAARPLLMGIVNVTPDSFSDGGKFFDYDKAIQHGFELIEQGADILDIGGESTRRGATAISEDEEIQRIIPVIKKWAADTKTPISVDTRNAKTAAAALDAGACIINDVSAFSYDPKMPALLGERKPLAIAMHMRGTPETMMDLTNYVSLFGEVLSELWNNAQKALSAGLPPTHLILDPGYGFSKDTNQNIELLHHLGAFVATGHPIVVAISRKTFIGQLTGKQLPVDRLFGTAAVVALAVAGGAKILRVHDVGPMKDVITVAHAICQAPRGGSC